MIYISHRGNTTGREKSENDPILIDKVLKRGYNAEIDVWKEGPALLLGHDRPEYEIELSFLEDKKLWCHAKNLAALNFMIENNIHCFWHEEDDFTLTSRGYIWTYPGKEVAKNSIIVCRNLEETMECSKLNIAGICSDLIGVLE